MSAVRTADHGLPSVPDEVVTYALIRYLTPPGLDGEIALVTLENGRDHERPSTFGPTGLSALRTSLDEISARQPRVRAIAVTGKPYVFSAGADLKAMSQLRFHDDALAIAKKGRNVFARLRETEIPTFAFINGAALGGGLELALHCHYRSISGGARTIALPECSIGLLPGWGGCWLLPNLIGPEKALKVIVENPLNQNQMLQPRQALELGIADVQFEAVDFLERSLAWAVAVLNGEASVERPKIARGEEWDIAVLSARKLVDERLHGAASAPYQALDLVAAAKTVSYEAGAEGERTALADLSMSSEFRASLYAFDLVKKRARRPAGAPDPELARSVTKVGIVGAGLMASQMATLFARQLEVPVVLTDIDAGQLARGVTNARLGVAALAEKGRISSDTANRVTGLITGAAIEELSDADFVIEAVFEDPVVKQQAFAEIERVVAPSCVIATNTSALSVTAMAAGLTHSERVVGLHFFNPVAVLPLVEVIRGVHTDAATLATAFAFVKQLKKSAVLVKDAPAFVVNRVLARFIGGILAAIDEGADAVVADHVLDSLGMPMSPLTLLELVGLPIALHVSETLHAAYPERFGISKTLQDAVKLGKSSLLTWRDGEQQLDPDVAAASGIAIAPHAPRPLRAPGPEQVREQTLVAIADEIQIMLEEGVVAAPEDIDLCLILGAGWPFHLGGITPALDSSGLSTRLGGRPFHPLPA